MPKRIGLLLNEQVFVRIIGIKRRVPSCIRARSPQSDLSPEIRLPEWAEDKARGIARKKGRDYYVLRSDWLSFAKSEAAKGNPPKNSGAAFLAYCNKQKSLR